MAFIIIPPSSSQWNLTTFNFLENCFLSALKCDFYTLSLENVPTVWVSIPGGYIPPPPNILGGGMAFIIIPPPFLFAVKFDYV